MFSGWCFTTNNSSCKGGRVMVAWNPNAFTVSVLGMSSQMIHCLVCPRNSHKEFFCTSVYAFNHNNERVALWKDLCGIGGNMNKPWVVMGDFNCVLNVEERIGAPVRHQSMVDFRNCVTCCGLEDVNSAGHFFTWNNKQEGDNRVFSKIDRVMANDMWMQLFPSAEAGFLSEGLFDHCPMGLSVYPCNNTARKPFRYFDMWKHADGYTELVKANWDKHDVGTPMYQVVLKLRRMKGVFKQLNKDGFNDIQAADLKALHELTQCQRELHMNPTDSGVVDKENAAANQYRIVHSVYLSFLRQKSKEAWAKGGDENSAIFHKY
ncbi:uncharacterized protein [Spinacia oleracea]|uniref:Endonuclease/exonuclease/phosphatase domain-containing protein n=1 Tax=Spinacia oleracea TaxID=3562 RepID=A0ABM3QQZ7_SPIOL|nr:uncharacterized protein LOC130461643 [Spinacia oleracea]